MIWFANWALCSVVVLYGKDVELQVVVWDLWEILQWLQ